MPDQYDAVAGARILICEDDPLFAEDMATTLMDLGYEIAGTAATGEEAIRAVEELGPDLIMMDINLTGQIDGIEAAEQIRAQFDIPLVYWTTYTETEIFERAKHTEPYAYVSKPFAFLELKWIVETVLCKHRTDRKVKESEARRAKAEELASLHSWEWDIRTGHLTWSAESCRALGLHPGETDLTLDTFINSVHVDDRDQIGRAHV